MSHAIRFAEVGGPEVLRLEPVDLPAPAEGQVLLRHEAIGVNFIDVYHRTGLYPLPLPSGLGQEGAGVVEAVGPGVTQLAPGDRVAYAGLLGAYADRRLAPAERLVRLPDGVEAKTAAAVMLKGMTARYLLRATHHVKEGEVVVVHAAAGGTGQLLVKWALHLGATVVAVVGSDAKAELVRSLGASHVCVTPREDFVATTLAASGGRGADVVYDSVGRDTFARSLEALRVRGLMVSFGQASGPVPPVELSALAKKCLYLTRPSLFAYVASREELEHTANDVFDAIAAGVLRPAIGVELPLERAADAHRALESRSTTGSVVLLP